MSVFENSYMVRWHSCTDGDGALTVVKFVDFLSTKFLVNYCPFNKTWVCRSDEQHFTTLESLLESKVPSLRKISFREDYEG